MSHANPEERKAYHRNYYARNKELMREQARKRFARKHSSRGWCYWLLDTLEFPPEPEYIVAVPMPIRRPVLSLRRTSWTNEINELGE